MVSTPSPLAAGEPTPAFVGTTVSGLPGGYVYMVTRYADVILAEAFPQHWADITTVLDNFRVMPVELWVGGGGRSLGTQRFDNSLHDLGWAKHNIHVRTEIDEQVVTDERGHEIDMFKLGPGGGYPGIGEETEWNNKDPFFDRDLANFYTLHRAGALAVGIIVTRGPGLQERLVTTTPWGRDQVIEAMDQAGLVLPPKWKGPPAGPYGESSTHWDKLVPRVKLGGGGECPLLLIGIEPERVSGDLGSPNSRKRRPRRSP